MSAERMKNFVIGVLIVALAASVSRVAMGSAQLEQIGSLSNNEGKASTIGFYEVVLGNPIAGFERLSALPSLRPADLTAVAQRYLKRSARTVILVRPQTDPAESGLDDDPDADEPITTRRGAGVPA